MNRKIEALLVERGIKQKDIADALGVAPCVVSGVLGGYFRSRRVRRHIAQVLGKDYEKLWGNAA